MHLMVNVRYMYMIIKLLAFWHDSQLCRANDSNIAFQYSCRAVIAMCQMMWKLYLVLLSRRESLSGPLLTCDFGPVGSNLKFGEIRTKIQSLSHKKMNLKISSTIWWLFCLGLSVSRHTYIYIYIYAIIEGTGCSGCAVICAARFVLRLVRRLMMAYLEVKIWLKRIIHNSSNVDKIAVV